MELTEKDAQWKVLYRIAGIAVICTIVVMVVEMFLSMMPDGSRTTDATSSITGWFDLFQRNEFMAMRNLGLINIIATTLTLPVFFALFGLHRKENIVLAGFTLILYVVSYAIFIADNSVLPMFALNNQYLTANAETQQQILSAGTALIARGASHTPGTFPGFFLSELASILVSILMIKGAAFKRITGIIGILAFSFLFIFEVMSSFFPSTFEFAMIIVMIGGIAALVWYVQVASGLLKASR